MLKLGIEPQREENPRGHGNENEPDEPYAESVGWHHWVVDI